MLPTELQQLAYACKCPVRHVENRPYALFSVFIANVSVSVSFERLYFRFYIISVSKITSVSVSVNVGSIISVSVIVSVTGISLVHCRGAWVRLCECMIKKTYVLTIIVCHSKLTNLGSISFYSAF